ncbi:MAG: hypothetical protein R3C68_13800 [Myxococcota bacterium]
MKNGSRIRLVGAVVFSAALLSPPSARAETAEYTIDASVNPNPLQKDQAATLALTIKPQGSWVLKTETPFRVVLKAPKGVTLKKDQLSAKDIVDAKSADKTVLAPFTSKQSGKHEITAELTFFLCSDEVCQRHKDTAKAVFTVK